MTTYGEIRNAARLPGGQHFGTLMKAFEEAVRMDQREQDARRAEKISHDKVPGFGAVIAAMIRADADRLEAVDIDSVLSGQGTTPSAAVFSEQFVKELEQARDSHLKGADERSAELSAYPGDAEELKADIAWEQRLAAEYTGVLAGTTRSREGTFSPHTLAELRSQAATAALVLEEYRSDREVAFGALRLTELDALIEQAQRYAEEYAALLAWAEGRAGG